MAKHLVQENINSLPWGSAKHGLWVISSLWPVFVQLQDMVWTLKDVLNTHITKQQRTICNRDACGLEIFRYVTFCRESVLASELKETHQEKELL